MYQRAFFCVLSLFAAVCISISLLSYNHNDASILHSFVERTSCQNYLGCFGAQIAAILLYLFGFSAYLLVIFFVLIAYICFRKRSFFSNIDRLYASLLLIGSTATLAAVLGYEPHSTISPGGCIGIMISLWLKQHLDSDIVYTVLIVTNFALYIAIFRVFWPFTYVKYSK
jgi:DNA segregation ATPase FtsK/SpoIIIE, S-DNA-T family